MESMVKKVITALNNEERSKELEASNVSSLVRLVI